jgi:hypothetical protein
VLASVATLSVISFLAQRELYDPEVSDGKVVVGVKNSRHGGGELEATLKRPARAMVPHLASPFIGWRTECRCVVRPG